MNIKKLTDREHLLLRPAMYIGATDLTASSEYVFDEDKIQFKEVRYVPGLLKIINEIIDNSVDVAIKSGFKDCNLISVKIDSDSVEVQDNGSGIPVLKNSDGNYLPELAWGHARAGSNFDDDANRTQIGMNGVGSFATNCFSTKFVGTSDDGKKSYQITFKNNASEFTEKLSKSKSQGVNVKFWPDLSRFGLSEIDEVHKNLIFQRLINLSMSFPEITFKFNARKINVGTFKKYIQMFSNVSEVYETDNYKFAILHNPDDDFRQFSYVNGLKIPDGGTHIDVIINTIVYKLRDKLAKKFKTIKPGDIRNKLMIVAFLKNVKNTKFNSQSKEKITNSIKEINDYFGEIPYDQIVNKIFRNSEIIDPITEVYRIKEEFKRRQELKGLKKSVKKIKSEKYLPSTGSKKYLMICEGESARGGLMPILGRKECGYYELKGKPLNAYSADQKRFTGSKELTELFKIIENENYDYVVFATDQDLDGFHIRGLLVGFIQKYLSKYKHKIGMLQTPVIIVKKGNKPIRWAYNLNDEVEIKKGESSKYYKGLGTHNPATLKEIIQKDGLSKMIDVLKFDSDEIIDEWLGNNSEPRKAYIIDNDFSIAKL